ncbi:glycine zipper family protein [Methanobrevibacter sp.]|uniref:glycine zipper family protein n=1 Tax=Methanobrevibacter sp. TaxID=66852 RepID=UPI003865E4A5
MSDEIPIKIKPKTKSRKKPLIKGTLKFTKGLVEDTAGIIFHEKDETPFPQKGYEESLTYIREHKKSKVEFPVDSKSKDKLSKMLSPDFVGSAGGLIGAAATVGLIGSTLGTGLLIAGAGALIGSVMTNSSDELSWVASELVILSEELVISGRFTLHFDEIKYVSVDRSTSNELVVLTLKDKALAFRTYNAKALKTVINEAMDNYYNNNRQTRIND